jgi:hypothetical protein
MEKKIDFNSQFSMKLSDYMKGIDLSNWFRYYAILKEVIFFSPKKILEIGAGNEVVKNCLEKSVEKYTVVDINPKLKPDILSDSRVFRAELEGKFDCLICAEVLEHMPFEDLNKNLANIYRYLDGKGTAIITVPRRRARFMVITPLSYEKPWIFELPFWVKSPKSFYKQVIKGNIWIDPHHCWEIGDGKVNKDDFDKAIKEAGFKIIKFKKLLQVDLWVLKKN